MSIFINHQRLLTDSDNLSGRNYLLGTSEPLFLKANNAIGALLGNYYFSGSLNFNEEYTFQAIIHADQDGGMLFCGNNPNWFVYHYQTIKKGDNLVTIPAQKLREGTNFRFTVDNSSAQITMRNATLNKGTVIKEWQPAPEDYVMQSDFNALRAKVESLTNSKNGGVQRLSDYVPLEMEVA